VFICLVARLTFVEICLIEVLRSRNIHVVQTCDLILSACAWSKVQGSYIAMSSEVLEQLDLSQRTLCENLLAEDIGHFLDSDALSILGVGRRAVHMSDLFSAQTYA
jgi:hypothetical protein